ncbi:alpha/beta fold hydrolase [Fusobacterium ulcerans]|uniref:alpha/beta fold hydrolase n=1 Tax=Fusobacterium ulcerans TaxID=861 RepID=UPI001D0BA98B|nr:alpha/beta hydrolase [Fusobacterium ulcerans]MCB8563842.1 alpha/beta hydrolase [Fusobacterium ulcerans]MCB8648318.1 alpha/beta hydrolase [Fusobacterium ulcerans]
MKFSYIDEGKGETLVFIHSYLWDKEMWRPQIEELKKDFRCIAIDLPNHGESENVVGSISLNEIGRDISDLLKELKIEKYSYVGLSVGGMLVPYIYNLDKDKINKIIIMDSYVGEESFETKELYFSMLDAIEKAKYIPDALVEKIAPMFFSPSIDKSGVLYKTFVEKLREMPEEKIEGIVKLGRVIFGRENALNLLSEIDKPTYFLVGEYDIPRPYSESIEMATYIKDCKVMKIKNAGHISNLENIEETNKILTNILK